MHMHNLVESEYQHMKLTHAIVTDTTLDYLDTTSKAIWTEKSIDTTSLVSAGSFIDLASTHNKVQLWVLPGSELSNRFQGYDNTFVTSDLEQYDIFPRELNPFLSGWKIGTHGDVIQLGLPEYMDDTNLNIKKSKDLYATLTYAQAATGITFEWSSGRTGMNLLQLLNSTPERKPYTRMISSDLNMFYDNASVETYWSRILTPDELDKKYVHIYDINGAFLNIYKDVHVGGGEYQHEVQPMFDRKVPGLWHTEITGTSPFNGDTLPHPTNGKLRGLFDTSMVQSAILCGYNINTIEGYLFREHHTTFKPVYDRLTNARTVLRTDTAKFKNETARLAALSIVKSMYSRGTGLMGYPLKPNQKRYWYNRPDMRNAIVSASNNRMFWYLVQHQKQGYTPVAIYVDDMYYLSDNPNPNEAIPVLRLSQEVGQFRHKESYRLSDIKHLFTGRVHDLVQGIINITPVSTSGTLITVK